MASTNHDTHYTGTEQFYQHHGEPQETASLQYGAHITPIEPYSNGADIQPQYHTGGYTNVDMDEHYSTGQQGKEPYQVQYADPQPPAPRDGSKPLYWSHKPRRLQGGHFRLGELGTNIISLLAVFLLVIYIAFLIVFDGAVFADVGTAGHFLREISQLGPTIVPILFAFIVGRAIRTLAHWRLQQGERIGMLDLFYGSTTVTGTLSTMLELRRIGLLELFLATIWALSPLGGQAILRVLSFQDAGVLHPMTLPVLNMSSQFPESLQSGDPSGFTIPVNTLVLTSMGAPANTRASSQDTWGNLKIPMLEDLPEYKGPQDKTWIEIGDRAVNYSSLLGIPVGNIDATRNTSFNLETSYTRLSCPVLQPVPNITATVNTMASGDPNLNTSSNCGNFGCSVSVQWGYIAALPFQEDRQTVGHCSDPNLDARGLQYFSFDSIPSNSNGTFANCTVTTTYVELAVECGGVTCKTAAMRPSTLSSNPGTNITVLDDCPADDGPSVFSHFMHLLGIFATSTQSSGNPSALQVFLVDPDSALNATARVYIPAVYSIGADLFSLRFTQLINTFWLASVATEALFLGHPQNYTDLSKLAGDTKFQEVQAMAVNPTIVIHCNRGWLAPLILSTLVMFVAALASLFLDLRIWVPRVMMNVSTMTRGNPNFGLPEGGGVLSDEERSRLLRNMKVRFGEGNPESGTQGDIGDLMIGDCIEDEGRVARFRGDRYYS